MSRSKEAYMDITEPDYEAYAAYEEEQRDEIRVEAILEFKSRLDGEFQRVWQTLPKELMDGFEIAATMVRDADV